MVPSVMGSWLPPRFQRKAWGWGQAVCGRIHVLVDNPDRVAGKL